MPVKESNFRKGKKKKYVATEENEERDVPDKENINKCGFKARIRIIQAWQIVKINGEFQSLRMLPITKESYALKSRENQNHINCGEKRKSI